MSVSGFENNNILYSVHVSVSKDSPYQQLEKNELESLFQPFAQPIMIRILSDRKYGFVYFALQNDADKVIKIFNLQPPNYFYVQEAKIPVYVMSDKDRKKISREFAIYQKNFNKTLSRMQRENKRYREAMQLLNITDVKDSNDSDSDFNDGASTYSGFSKYNEQRPRSRSRHRSSFINNNDNYRPKSRSRQDFTEQINMERRDKSQSRQSFPNHNSFNAQTLERKPYQNNRQSLNGIENNLSNSRNKVMNWRENNSAQIRSSPNEKENIKSPSTDNNAYKVGRRREVHHESCIKSPDSYVKQMPATIVTKNIVNLLSTNHKGLLTIKSLINNDHCTIQFDKINDFQNDLSTIKNLWMDYSESDCTQPKVGDMVCIPINDTWSRGIVNNKDSNQYNVALIDEGVIATITKACKILPQHKTIPNFACLCKIIKKYVSDAEFKELYLVNKTYVFTVKSVDNKNESVICTLTDRIKKNHFCDVQLNYWELNINNSESIEQSLSVDNSVTTTNTEKFIPKSMLTFGAVVVLAEVISQQNMVVKHKDTNKYLQQIAELLDKYDGKLPKLVSPPKIGDFIAAQYSVDKKWYRGEIKTLSSDGKQAVVFYVDYGNKEIMEVDGLRQLVPSLLEIPRAVVEIKLKDMPCKVIQESQKQFIENLRDNSTKLKIIFERFYNGVTLLINENTSVNERLRQLDNTKTKSQPVLVEQQQLSNQKHSKEHKNTSIIDNNSKNNQSNRNERQIENKDNEIVNPKQCNEPAERVDINESSNHDDKVTDVIDTIDVPLGNNKFVFIDIIVNSPDSKMVICYPNDDKLMYKIQTTLTDKLSAYVAANKYEKVVPVKGGYYIAKFEDEWYRALCLTVENDNAHVLFIDYGNADEVLFEYMRPLPDQFKQEPAFALICTVEDVPDSLTCEQFESLLEKMKTYDCDVISKDDGQFNVRFPHISQS